MIFDNSTQLWNITTFNEWENSLKMDIFNSYFKFAEGNLQWNSRFSSISYIQLVDLLEPKDVSQTVRRSLIAQSPKNHMALSQQNNLPLLRVN